MKTIALIAVGISLLTTPAFSEDRTVTKPAINEPPTGEKVGSRPYEMENRRDDRIPLVDFQDLAGWTVECANGADAGLTKSREQKMWGEFTGKLTYTGKSDTGTVIVRPPKPIPIKSEFDCVGMWINGNVWEWAPEPGSPMVNISVIVADSSGKEHTLPPTRMRWKEWWLTHAKLGEAMKSASFVGIKVEGINNPEPRSIYFGGLYFYKEELKPLTYKPRPARNLTLLPGQDQGLNGTGKGKLPFPTREETILPSNFANDYSVSLNKVGQTYEFEYKGKDTNIKYVYRPATGNLGEITAYVNGRKFATPMNAGGIELDEAKASAVTGKLVDAKINGNELHVAFDLEKNKQTVRAEYILRIWQKSLVMDFICRGGRAWGLLLGDFQGVTKPRLHRIPFVSFGWNAHPMVLCSGEPNDPVFASVWVDWYRSNGSALWTDSWTKDNTAKINGGVNYTNKTDGKRNDLYERVFLTISPTYEEVLPTIANPPSPRAKIAGERLWQESWGPENYAKEMKRSEMLRSYGIDKLTQCNHEITWRDCGESFTLRTKAAPGRGGDKALQDYIAHQKSLGWLSGLYTNYTDFAPVNENWNEDYVQRTPEGEWRTAWPRNYAEKPSRAVELDAKYAPAVHKKYGTTAAYTDVQTAVAPWGYCDFDARVPGAGTFAATFYAYGELLLNDQKIYGPIWSEGSYQWLYAGLATGNYALAYNGVDMSKEPLDVVFDLMKIHTLETDIGMPWTSQFFKESGWDKPENIDQSIDHFIGASIAYGHIGWLVEETHGIERTCRSYYMMQQLQKRYTLQAPASVEYVDTDGKPLTASQALAQDVMTDSRLHVVYKNGLQIFVNGSAVGWTVKGRRGESIELPSWGWCAWDKKGDFQESSSIVDGSRVDYVKSPDYEYLDARGTRTQIGGISVKGAVAVRRMGDSVEIIDIYGNDEISLEASGGKCTAYDGSGKSLGSVQLTRDGKKLTIKAVENARKYVVTGE